METNFDREEKEKKRRRIRRRRERKRKKQASGSKVPFNYISRIVASHKRLRCVKYL